MTVVLLVIMGVGIYLLIWFDHSRLPNPNGAGEWRSAPRWLRPAVRRGNSPVIIPAVAGQAAALVMVVSGVIAAIGPMARQVGAVAYAAMTIAWCVALLSVGLVTLRARRWDRDRSRRRPVMDEQAR